MISNQRRPTLKMSKNIIKTFEQKTFTKKLYLNWKKYGYRKNIQLSIIGYFCFIFRMWIILTVDPLTIIIFSFKWSNFEPILTSNKLCTERSCPVIGNFCDTSKLKRVWHQGQIWVWKLGVGGTMNESMKRLLSLDPWQTDTCKTSHG